jgi:hypothetical protein
MSYKKMMRWHKKHPRGGKPQYMGFSAGSGFCPAMAWTEWKRIPYLMACETASVEPLGAKEQYDAELRGCVLSQACVSRKVQYTKQLRRKQAAERK